MGVVVALGGHLLAEGALDQVRDAVRRLDGDPLLVTHGNGPQVGEQLELTPDLPVHVAVARTQAEIGSQLARALGAVCVITHVVVDPHDPGFAEPTKPIGPWLGERPEAPALHDPERGWRRVIASPLPLEIVELETIRALARAGAAVVCCGGGGIPVADGRGVAAVIDKDWASSMLAEGVGAGRLVVLTDVDAVYRDFRSASATPIERLSATEADALARELPAGSMGPKLSACASFVRATGGEALVTSPDGLARGVATRISP